MLTKDLLEVEKNKPNIKPYYRDIDKYRELAEKVLNIYRVGKKRKEIEDKVSDLETHDNFKFVRGLSKLLDDKCVFEQKSPIQPWKLREKAFEKGFVTTEKERNNIIKKLSKEFHILPEEVEKNLWSDREEEQVLVDVPKIDSETLLREYNLSLTQTLLFDATDLEFNVSDNYQEIFGLIKYLGLMYNVDEDLSINVTGPASLFKKTRKYGTTMAKLVPSIIKADDWSISAQIETKVNKEKRIYKFEVDSKSKNLFPNKTVVELFDSEVEREFAARIKSLMEEWNISREPTILRSGEYVMIPDFSFKRNKNEFYIEIIGFWTPGYIEKKLEKIKKLESDKPIILLVNKELNCTKNDFKNKKVEEVIFYDDDIPIKPIVKRLKKIKETEVEKDLKLLNKRKIKLDQDEITDIDKVAEKHSVESDAMKKYIRKNFQGVISNNQYIPIKILEDIKKEIQNLDSNKLSDINPILDRYNIGQDILEEIGYSIKYISLDQNEAKVKKQK